MSQTQTKPKRYIVQVEYPAALADRLKRQAKREMLTRSALLRRISQDYLEKQETTNASSK